MQIWLATILILVAMFLYSLVFVSIAHRIEAAIARLAARTDSKGEAKKGE